MEKPGRGLLGACLVLALSGGCSSTPTQPREQEAPKATHQSLAFVPPIGGGALLVAGSGVPGNADNVDPTRGALRDPAAVLFYPYTDPQTLTLNSRSLSPIGATTRCAGLWSQAILARRRQASRLMSQAGPTSWSTPAPSKRTPGCIRRMERIVVRCAAPMSRLWRSC
jgi:hypothetical protein